MVNETGRKSIFQNVISFAARYIDYPSAFAGALIMGIMVGIINMRYGVWPATTAALKQATYTFLFGGLIIKFLYLIVVSIPGRTASLVIPVFITSVITITLVYLVHCMKGTPLPFESTLPTVLLAPPGFFLLAWKRRKRSR